MKEQKSDLRLTTFIETQPTTFPLTSRKTSFLSQQKSTSPVSKNVNVIDEELNVPKILSSARYNNIYQQILNDMVKTSRHFCKQDLYAEKETVKKSIQKVLKKKEEENDFNQRFPIHSSPRCKTARTNNNNLNIGASNTDKEDLITKTFFRNYKKVVNLEEECMLVEYYLKDQEKQVTPVNYLANISGSSRHRRLTPSHKDSIRLYQTHDERQYHSLKRRIHVKQSFVQKCSKIAKNNSTYRRKQNFKKIEYIRSQNNKNMNEQTIIIDEAEGYKNKLLQNNRCWRLFLNFALLDQHMKIYYSYIDKQGLFRFKSKLFTLDTVLSTKEKLIDAYIAKIVEFKLLKVLQFQDFRELIYFIAEITSLDIMNLFVKNSPDYFQRRADLIIKQQADQIQKWAAFHKIKFSLHIIFNTQKEILIGSKILPVKYIPGLFKTYGLTQKDLSLSKISFYYHWVQHHNLGLTFQQFFEGSILMNMKGQNWKRIQSFLKKINISKLL